MKLFRKKSSPKDGSKPKRSSRISFDSSRRRSSASSIAEEKQSLLGSAALEKRTGVSNESGSSSSMTSKSEGDYKNTNEDKTFAAAPNTCDTNADGTMTNKDKYESLESSQESEKRATTEQTTEAMQTGSTKVDFAEEENREDPPGDQNYQYGAIQVDSTTNKTTPTPRKTAKTSKIINFLRKKVAKTDPLNTTIETSPSSDSDHPANTGPHAESRDSGDATETKAPVRSGPVEIINVDLSKLIKHKNAVKKKPEQPVLRPLKPNRSRPQTMSMSKRNEEQFQRYIQRQNRGRKARESHLVPSFH
ncbi:MAG: hypothetical protein SGBAC_003337 [Bacillariaceae sp.]